MSTTIVGTGIAIEDFLMRDIRFSFHQHQKIESHGLHTLLVCMNRGFSVAAELSRETALKTQLLAATKLTSSLIDGASDELQKASKASRAMDSLASSLFLNIEPALNFINDAALADELRSAIEFARFELDIYCSDRAAILSLQDDLTSYIRAMDLLERNLSTFTSSCETAA